MNADIYEIELRFSPATARLGLAAALLCLLASNTISENMTFNTQYPVPSGAFDGLTVTGLDTGGNPRPTILDPCGTDATCATPNGAVGIATGGNALAPGARLISQSGMSAGVNAAPLATIHTGGAGSGLALASINSGAWWSIYPSGRSIKVAFSGGSPIFAINANGSIPLCTTMSYSFPGPLSGDACPAGSYIVGQAGNGPSSVSGVPIAGSVTCCRLQEEMP